MKIALINENSQAAKNEMIFTALKKVAEPLGHEVFNYGMYGAEDPNSLTYVQNGILAAVLLNSGAADFVVTGCGTGEGAMLACILFGFCNGVKVFVGSGSTISPHLISMIPYVVTIIVLILFVGKSHVPAANGKPYEKAR